jgi:hypothetical protein
MAPNDAEVRKMNLIDMLADDFDGVEEPPEYAVQLWTEDQIRQYFEKGGDLSGLPVPKVAVSLDEVRVCACDSIY